VAVFEDERRVNRSLARPRRAGAALADRDRDRLLEDLVLREPGRLQLVDVRVGDGVGAVADCARYASIAGSGGRPAAILRSSATCSLTGGF
jgi:hypothetical protein